MRWWPWVGALAAASAATLIYGAAVEANRLTVERLRLRLPGWPRSKKGYKIALLADMHLRDEPSVDLAQRAVYEAMVEEPDAILLLGDYVGHWRAESASWLIRALEPLSAYHGLKLAVPGNHDYWGGNPDWLMPIFRELGIHLLRNEVRVEGGVCWVGVDSANAYQSDPFTPMMEAASAEEPMIVLWHEPDMVDYLPSGAALMVSGHSHGGQFTFPWGWTPMHTDNGRKYPRGFYPNAPTPIYVSRGIGVTGPPSRLCCAPEVSILTLEPQENNSAPQTSAT